MDFEVQITRTTTTRRLLTLTGKANQLPISHARRNRDANCVRLHIQRAIRLQIRALQLERARRRPVRRGGRYRGSGHGQRSVRKPGPGGRRGPGEFRRPVGFLTRADPGFLTQAG